MSCVTRAIKVARSLMHTNSLLELVWGKMDSSVLALSGGHTE